MNEAICFVKFQWQLPCIPVSQAGGDLGTKFGLTGHVIEIPKSLFVLFLFVFYRKTENYYKRK